MLRLLVQLSWKRAVELARLKVACVFSILLKHGWFWFIILRCGSTCKRRLLIGVLAFSKIRVSSLRRY